MTLHYTNFSEPAVDSRPATRPNAFSFYRYFGKRVMDIALVLLAAPIILMVVGTLALFVAIRGGKPFYLQNRVGQNGRIYTMWKLRSMVADADAHLEAHLAKNPEARREWDSTQKLKSDPRITAFGQFLRKSSLDELPQLWNVLKGDMSLVGPRPMMVCQKAIYPGQDYYALRPGITGPWQVSARNDSTFADRANYDTRYNQDLSFMTDTRLILSTFKVVLRATGH
jgi:exopolysaccharide production protein ExoY